MGAEDFDLCAKIRNAGFSIWADLDIPLGHMAPYTAYKTKDSNGNWGTTLALDSQGGVFIPD